MASAVLNDPTNAASSQYLYRFPAWMLLLVAALLALVYVAFSHAIAFMIGQWNMEEFSHGYLIPFISGFLVWQRRGALRRVDFKGSWTGLAVVVVVIAALPACMAAFAPEAVARLSPPAWRDAPRPSSPKPSRIAPDQPT